MTPHPLHRVARGLAALIGSRRSSRNASLTPWLTLALLHRRRTAVLQLPLDVCRPWRCHGLAVLHGGLVPPVLGATDGRAIEHIVAARSHDLHVRHAAVGIDREPYAGRAFLIEALGCRGILVHAAVRRTDRDRGGDTLRFWGGWRRYGCGLYGRLHDRVGGHFRDRDLGRWLRCLNLDLRRWHTRDRGFHELRRLHDGLYLRRGRRLEDFRLDDMRNQASTREGETGRDHKDRCCHEHQRTRERHDLRLGLALLRNDMCWSFHPIASSWDALHSLLLGRLAVFVPPYVR